MKNLFRRGTKLGHAFEGSAAFSHTSSSVKSWNTTSESEWQDGLFYRRPGIPSQEQKLDRWRFVPLYCAFCLGFLLLFLKSGQLQLIEGKKNRILSEGNRVRMQIVSAPRGIIYDNNMTVLARNATGYKVAITPQVLVSDEKQSIFQLLAQILGMPFADLEKKATEGSQQPFTEMVLKNNIDHETRLEILAREKELPGVVVEEDIIRDYPGGSIFSHLIGYTGEISSDDLQAQEFSSYYSGDRIGTMGLEQTYEKQLRGVVGKKLIEVDAFEETERILAENEAQPGYSLVTSIDAKLQRKAAEYLQEGITKYDATGGVVIVQNPQNGQITSLISLPSFDNNLFAQGISQDEYASLSENAQKPLYNRAIAGAYPSGSTIKPLIASAALQEGIITQATIVNDTGALYIGSYRFPCWTVGYGIGSHGPVNVVDALSQSCDVFFYTVGGGYGDQQGLGIEKIAEYARKFGLGEQSGIDLSGEATGLVPSPLWKEETYGEPWYLGDTYWVSIGQSYISLTPLQITNAISAIANRGTLLRPYLVTQIINTQNEVISSFDREIIRTGFISDSNLALVREGMYKSVHSGIIIPLRNTVVPVAAKTGTAEYGVKNAQGNYQTHAWVTGYAPYDNPQMTFTVLLEGGGASNNAAEVAKKIINWYFSDHAE